MRINSINMHFLLVLLLAIGSPAYAANTDRAQMERRMALLDKLDKLDALDFEDSLDEANSCIKKRNFSCAERNIENAKDTAVTNNQHKRLKYALQDLAFEKKMQRMEWEAERKRNQRIREAEEAEARARIREKKLAKKRKAQERRDARAARDLADSERRREWANALDNRINNHMAELNQTLQNSQDAINASIRNSQQQKARREAARRSEEKRNREEIENRRREMERQQQARQEQNREEARRERERLAQRRKQEEQKNSQQLAQVKQNKAQKDQERTAQKQPYQLVVEAAVFCWESKKNPDTWKCRGPRHLANSTDSTSFKPDILEQARSTRCNQANNNSKQAWSTGDQTGYVYLCNTPLRKHDADVMNDYGMPNYIRKKRKVFICDRPIMQNCKVHTTGMGEVPNWRDIDK